MARFVELLDHYSIHARRLGLLESSLCVPAKATTGKKNSMHSDSTKTLGHLPPTHIEAVKKHKRRQKRKKQRHIRLIPVDRTPRLFWVLRGGGNGA